MSSTKDRVFLDTNVIVYAYDTLEPAKQKRAQDLLRTGLPSGRTYVSAQVLGELFVVLTRKIARPLAIAEAITVVQGIGKLEVVEIGVLAVNLAMHYAAGGALSYWDALIVAAARLGECATLLSEDISTGLTFDTVTVSNPFL
jgi:predicted nucleic acid-binding protein